MFEFVALTYGVLASFIMTSASRNRRDARKNPMILNLFGWGMMSFSLVAALFILSYIAYQMLSGQPIEGPVVA
jgi:hypothetical protein